VATKYSVELKVQVELRIFKSLQKEYFLKSKEMDFTTIINVYLCM
jgi:hypothetical protein